MPNGRALHCPKCSTVIELTPLAIPMVDEASGEATGAALKRCPACRSWSWMTLERERAN